MQSNVLVVVDMQNGFVNPSSAHVVPVIAGIVRDWQSRGGATIFTRFVNAESSLYERLIGWTRCRTSPDIDIVDELEPFTHDGRAVVVDKPGYTLFTPPGRDLLDRGGWTDLVICGIATESCVTKTAADAFEAGLVPWILTDATASHASEEAHRAGLLVLGRFVGGGQLVSTDALAKAPAHVA